MSVDLFSLKLKAAKRELLGLKTAHTRGLGNIRIYTTTIEIDPTGHTSGIYFIDLVVDFDASFAAYPFVNFVPSMSQTNEYYFEPIGLDYSNDGRTLNVRGAWFYYQGTNYVKIQSTAPIVNWSYTWEN